MDGQEDIIRAQDPDVRVRIIAAITRLIIALAALIAAVAVIMK